MSALAFENQFAAVSEPSAVTNDAQGLSPRAEEILSAARQQARLDGISYAGRLTPELAWELVSRGEAQLVDVRTGEELKFVGHVPNSLHVPWMIGTHLVKNPRFAKELQAKLSKDAVVLLLCRSGKRSAAAADAATRAGFQNVFNILEGFEGDLDDQQRRGENGGWRRRGLPWVQD